MDERDDFEPRGDGGSSRQVADETSFPAVSTQNKLTESLLALATSPAEESSPLSGGGPSALLGGGPRGRRLRILYDDTRRSGHPPAIEPQRFCAYEKCGVRLDPSEHRLKRYCCKEHAQAQSSRFHPKRISDTEIARLFAEGLDLQEEVERPTVRAECEAGGAKHMRPCPFVSCSYHLYLDTRPTGALRINYPVPPDELQHSCALDVADLGGLSLEDVGAVMGMTRERVRQIERAAQVKLARKHPDLHHLVAGDRFCGVPDGDGLDSSSDSSDPLDSSDLAFYDESSDDDGP